MASVDAFIDNNGTRSLLAEGPTSTIRRLQVDAADALQVALAAGASSIGKAEDAAHTSGETGAFILGVRNDAQAAFSGTNLDYTPIAVDSAGRVQITDGAGSITVDNATISVVGGGVEAAAQRVTIATDSTGVLSVDDNGGNLSVDWAGTVPPIGAGTEAAALRVTVATDSTGVLSVDDNGASLTIDNAQLSVVGSGTEAAALRVTIATDSTGVLSVDDNGASVTVDNAQLSVVGSGTEAAAMRVTIATDSTGVLSVDDNGGNLSVDWAGTVPPIGAGTEAAALRVTVATDSTGVLSVDDNGASLTTDIQAPPATTTGAWSRAAVAAYLDRLVVKGSAGRLRLVIGYNSGPAQFVQVHNTTTLPADTAVPIYTFAVAAASNFSLDLGELGDAFSTGITLGNSTTGATLTSGADDCWFTAMFI